MRSFFRSLVVVGIVGTTVAACGSSDSRERNVPFVIKCAQGGLCKVGDLGPGGGIVFVGGDKPGDLMWEAAPVNGYGTHDEAVADSDEFQLETESGSETDWELPTAENLDAMYEQADLFACSDTADCSSAYADDVYWSFDQDGNGKVIAKSFADGSAVEADPTEMHYYRPVRSFQMADVATDAPTTTPASTSATTTEAPTTTAQEPTTTEAATTTVAADEPTTTVEPTTTEAPATTVTPTTEAPSTTAVAPTTTPTPTTKPKITTASCAEGGPCNVGDIGPGGGLVLLADFMLGEPSTLIEVAPTTWFGTAAAVKKYVETLKFGGLDDWVVPNLSQLLTMRRERARFACAVGTRCTNGFNPSTYWAANPTDPTNTVSFAGTGDAQLAGEGTSHFVRPVRVLAVGGAGGTLVTIPPLAEA